MILISHLPPLHLYIFGVDFPTTVTILEQTANQICTSVVQQQYYSSCRKHISDLNLNFHFLLRFSTEVGEEIQYEIDEMAFTADEKHVIYSNIYTNDIIFLDFKAQKKTKSIKGMTCVSPPLSFSSQ